MASADSSGGSGPLRRLHARLLSPPLETGSTRLLVGRAPDGFWAVAEPGGVRPLRRLVSREQALAVATSTLTESRGGLVEVVEENGSRQVIAVHQGKKPWWRTTRTPLGGLFVGLLWAGCFTLRVVGSTWPPPLRYETFVLVVSGLFAVLYLSTAVMRLIRGGRSRDARGPASPRQSRSG